MAGMSRTKTKAKPEAPSFPGEIFAFIAGAIGFIVDVVGLVGIISGFVRLPTGSFLESNPFALAVVSLFSVVYSLTLLLYFIRRKVHKRWHAQEAVLSKDADEIWMLMAAYLLWVPIFLIWSIAIWGAGVDAGYHAPMLAVVFVIFCIFGLSLGGGCLCEIVRYFDMALNPGEDLSFEKARTLASSLNQ